MALKIKKTVERRGATVITKRPHDRDRLEVTLDQGVLQVEVEVAYNRRTSPALTPSMKKVTPLRGWHVGGVGIPGRRMSIPDMTDEPLPSKEAAVEEAVQKGLDALYEMRSLDGMIMRGVEVHETWDDGRVGCMKPAAGEAHTELYGFVTCEACRDMKAERAYASTGWRPAATG